MDFIPLIPEQRDHFREHGYLIVPGALNDPRDIVLRQGIVGADTDFPGNRLLGQRRHIEGHRRTTARSDHDGRPVHLFAIAT